MKYKDDQHLCSNMQKSHNTIQCYLTLSTTATVQFALLLGRYNFKEYLQKNVHFLSHFILTGLNYYVLIFKLIILFNALIVYYYAYI